MAKCWQCKNFAVVFAKKKPVLDCEHSASAELSKDYGFIHDGCPGYEKDVEEITPAENQMLVNSYATLTNQGESNE